MKKNFAYGLVVYKIINSERFYLLLKSSNKKEWGFPKGHVDKLDNSKIDTAVRETYEETNLNNLEVDSSVCFDLSYKVKNNSELKFVGLFPAKYTSGDVVLSSEHVEYDWFSLEDALSAFRYNDLKDILINVHNYLILFND